MSNCKSAREVRDLFSKGGTSYYKFRVGKIVNGNFMSHQAVFDNIITNTETGHVLLRFSIKGHAIDLMFKPESDIVVQSSIIDSDNPVGYESIEQALKAIAEEADKKGM